MSWPADEARRRGRRLEDEAAEFFLRHGYEVARNRVLVGRSGAGHEVDVVAERGDELTTLRIAVECKAWAGPVPKEVVAKLDFIVRDIGFDRGVVVCPAGATHGARAAATELGVEIWGPRELRGRLSAPGLAAPAPSAGEAAAGYPARIDPEGAARRLERAARGPLGLGREAILAIGRLWLPWHALQLAITAREPRGRRRVRTRHTWNLYDGLAAELVHADAGGDRIEGAAPIVLEPAALAVGALPEGIADRIERAFAGLGELATETARARRIDRLAELAVPYPVEHVAVERIALIYQPFDVALLAGSGGQRVIALEAVAGRRDAMIEDLLTGHVGAVARALGADGVAPETGMNAR